MPKLTLKGIRKIEDILKVPGHFFHQSALLRELEELGLIEWEMESDHQPTRLSYRVTDAGLEVCHART
jgi:hypothetical protein